MPTPIGRLQILWDRDGVLCGVDWEDGQGPDGRGRLQRLLRSQNRVADIARVRASSQHPAVGALTAYFAGDLAAIDPLRAAPAGTAFQQRVWQALREIPAGTTVSYAALAARIGHPTAIRAVGAANGANPVSIIIPCHRLVGSDRSLTGYAGGVARKAWLLSHEGATGG